MPNPRHDEATYSATLTLDDYELAIAAKALAQYVALVEVDLEELVPHPNNPDYTGALEVLARGKELRDRLQKLAEVSFKERG